MLDPDEAMDILLDQEAVGAWAAERGMGIREARLELGKLAEGAEGTTKMLRMAREAQARRGWEVAGRTDVDELVDFVERAGALPSRLKEVFGYCVVHGMSTRECAERLGISRETVRAHLRRLRLLLRRCGGGVRAEINPG